MRRSVCEHDGVLSSRMLDAHDPSSWPTPVKLAGVGNRIGAIGQRSKTPAVRYAWRLLTLPLATALWAAGTVWYRYELWRFDRRQVAGEGVSKGH